MKREKAIKLRKNGLTYNQISKRLSLPKSTLSSWFKDLPDNQKIKQKNYNKAQKKWAQTLIDYNLKRAKSLNHKNTLAQQKAEKSIISLNKKDLKLIGAALYWAEGYKKTRWNIVFSNSDPDMIKLMMKFFLKVCQVPNDKIKGQVQTHPNVSEVKALNYWSKISTISLRQFRKSLIVLSKSSKQKRKANTLPYGTFRIIINDVNLVNKIKGWINGISKQF